MRYAFGGMTFSVNTDSASHADQVRQRFAPFQCSLPDDVEIAYRVMHHLQFDPNTLYKARHHPLEVCQLGESIRITGAYFEAVVTDTGVRIDGPNATYPIDFVMAHLWLKRNDRAAIIHSAAISDGSVGWLCCGPSGSGKSTLARLLGPRALNDEFSGVQFVDEFKLVGLPFWRGRPGTVRLKEVLFLAHGDRNVRVPLSKSVAWQRLVRQVAWPLEQRVDVERTLDLITRLVHQVPCFQLDFVPNLSVWDTIAEVA